MPDLLAGTPVQALDSPPTVWAAIADSYDFTSTSYATSSTAGTYADCAVVFTAPTTGRVKISTSGRLYNTTTAGTLLSPETRVGETVGSGTIVESAADASGIANYSGTFQRQGASHVLSGLTPGAVYNTRLMHKATSGTGRIALRELIVEPLT